jgi:LPXTG-motif cell wall-anchored protein
MQRWIKYTSIVLIVCIVAAHAPISFGETIKIPQREYTFMPLTPQEEPEPEPEPAEDEGGSGGGGDNTALYIGVGVVAVAGMVWFILWRRKKAKQETTLYMDANLPLIEHPLNETVSLTMDSPLRQRLSVASQEREADVKDLYAVQVGVKIAF